MTNTEAKLILSQDPYALKAIISILDELGHNPDEDEPIGEYTDEPEEEPHHDPPEERE